VLHGSRITIPFDTGAAAGTKTEYENLDKFDLTRTKAIDIHVKLTTADTDAGDTFDIYLEETFDAVSWDERWRSHRFTGDMSPSATAPETREYILWGHTVTDVDDEIYESTGSAGGSSLAAGTVRHGPFAPKLPSTTAPFRGQVTHRLRYDTTDADSNARFTGVVTLVFHSPT
jgi:hypothetical protein